MPAHAACYGVRCYLLWCAVLSCQKGLLHEHFRALFPSLQAKLIEHKQMLEKQRQAARPKGTRGFAAAAKVKLHFSAECLCLLQRVCVSMSKWC